ncbi:MAG: FHA domain-containing protein [Bdellovibrionaceae bacterium]|nr:FHA domain-containing protein [Pseudobdellovibrionaceae bacterium]
MPRLRMHLNGAEIQTLDLNAGQSYVAGRAPGCEIPLGDHPGISRQHFRMLFQDGAWTVQVMSKFGEVQLNGEAITEAALTSGMMIRVPPYDFYFLDDISEASDSRGDARVGGASSTSKALAPYTGGHGHDPSSTDDEFSGDEEKTTVGQLQAVPYVKLTTSGGHDDTFRLEGNLWIAGRDGSCEIELNDPKASRKQFELAGTQGGYFITDLGSSNGTLLNGSPLVAHEPIAVRSGDVITVGQLTVTFELRDPNYKNKLVVIRQDVLQSTPMVLPQAAGGEMLSYPIYSQGPGGVVPLDPSGPAWQGPYAPPPPQKKFDLSQPKNKILLAVAILFVVLAFIFSGESPQGPGTPNGTQADPKTLAFQRLTEPQRKFIKDTYELAYTLFMQQKFELAEGQLRKIHEMLPEGYEESHKIAEDIQAVKSDHERRLEIERERQRIAQNQRVVNDTVLKCREVANRTMSIEEIQGCIAEAITLDPENEQLRGFVTLVQGKIEAERARAVSRANYANQLAKRRALYENAVAADRGDPLTAIAAHQKNIQSSLPDPDGLATKSRERVEELQAQVNQAVDRGLSEAQRLFDSGKLKEAYAALEQVRKIDPNSSKVTSLADRIVKDLNQQLKAVYEDSVLEEGLGNVDSAKEKWAKILEIDRPNGEYYRRARNKLRQYGGQ